MGYIAGLIIYFLGLILIDPLLLNIGLLIGLAYFIFVNVISSSIENKINPIILFSFGRSLSTIGNILGLYYADDPTRKWEFWYYANENYLFEAALIHTAGTGLLILGYKIYQQKINKSLLPKLEFTFNPAFLRRYDLFIWILILVINLHIINIPIPPRISNLVFSLLILMYAFLSQKEKQDSFHFIRGYALVAILSVNAYLHSFLRIETINPSILFFIGLIWGAGSIKVLGTRYLAPIYVLILLFGISFNQLGGENRLDVEKKNQILLTNFNNLLDFNINTSEVNGTDDFSYIFEPEYEEKSIWGRMASFNQLSKVAELQQQDGFLYGESIAYMTYAWIPRALWPEKPTIAIGRWFAAKAGLAYVNDDGDVNNSVDMSPAGELYLNFGYIGMGIGCFLLGIFWAVLWKAANFFTPYNLSGIMMGGYLLNQGYWQLGADLQIIITALSMYLTVLLIDVILRQLNK